jgi:hypothetical protein
MQVRSDRWRVRVAAVSAAVALHALLFVPLLLKPPPGTWAPPLRDARTAAQFRLAQTLVNTSIWLPDDINSSPQNRPSFREPDLAEVSLKSIRADLSPSVLQIPETDASPDVPPSAAAISGQIGLRCEVHVHQGPRGQVQAIDFGECNGDAAWQRSLIQALQSAVELVSPTSDVVFKPVRTFIFSTDSISADVLAKQLSVAEPIQVDTIPSEGAAIRRQIIGLQ